MAWGGRGGGTGREAHQRQGPGVEAFWPDDKAMVPSKKNARPHFARWEKREIKNQGASLEGAVEGGLGSHLNLISSRSRRKEILQKRPGSPQTWSLVSQGPPCAGKVGSFG